LAASAALKLLSSSIVFATRIESTRLLVSFCFFAAEIAFSFFLCDNAFKGIQYLAVRKNGDLVLKGYEVAKTFCTAFFLVKNIANFLPQVAIIFFPDVDADPDKVENYGLILENFRTTRSILMILGSLMLVVFGIYTARILRAYLLRIRSDQAFCRTLQETYDEKVTRNESMQQRIALKSAFFYFTFAALFLAELYLDNLSFFPQPIFAIFVFLGLQKLRNTFSISFSKLLPSLVAVFFVCISFVYRLIRLFTMESFEAKFPLDIVAGVLAILGQLSSVFLCLVMLLYIQKCAERFTEYPYRRYFVILAITFCEIGVLSYFQYLFPSEFAVLPFVQWCSFGVMMYYHKKTLDEIYQEAEYKLM